ncbi:hypothetical protein BDN67DRAFT_912021 [Paxillus ammoniavirescens]|nr:hypothetical protein BDN67DRAFT_912021 [Paxillus ammoniavirescens]
MSSSALSFYSNVFGLVAGGVSLIVLVFAFCRSQLPSNKIKVLEELLDGTQALVSSYVEKGYLPEEVRANIERRLVRLEEDTFDLRSQAYRATTFTEDYTGFFAGLSLAIGRACLEVKRLRAEVIVSSTSTTSSRLRAKTRVVRQKVRKSGAGIATMSICCESFRSVNEGVLTSLILYRTRLTCVPIGF